MVNQAFQPHFWVKQDALRMEAEYISTNVKNKGVFKVVLITVDLS